MKIKGANNKVQSSMSLNTVLSESIIGGQSLQNNKNINILNNNKILIASRNASSNDIRGLINQPVIYVPKTPN
jgi:hypothetical protein